MKHAKKKLPAESTNEQNWRNITSLHIWQHMAWSANSCFEFPWQLLSYRSGSITDLELEILRHFPAGLGFQLRCLGFPTIKMTVTCQRREAYVTAI